MRLSFIVLGFCLALTSSLTAAPPPEKLAPLPTVEIGYTKTVLKNGLTLIIHEDHKTPIVAVDIWYHVGSKNEPAGRTGFAHLFEHLMFGSKDGSQGVWFEKMEAMGATGINGSTNHDRTNFFETVPTTALDTALFLESQRMGHLLDNFDESVLTTQRGVVQNEKRQRENQPYAIANDIITKAVWPAGHPYSHTVIGEMADLDAAKISDVKDWYAKYYSPSNAVITLSGDITPQEAEAKVEKYFGALPAGAPVAHQKSWIAKRSGEQRATVDDRVSQARLYKVWNVPGDGVADTDYLDMFSAVLSWGKSSRLYKRLVYDDKIATGVSSGTDTHEAAGLFMVQIAAKPDVSLDRIEKAFNEEFARLLKDGPTAEELERAKTRAISGFIRSVERVGGTADLGSHGQTFLGSPDAWKESFDTLRNATPEKIKAAGRRWLSDGAFTLEIKPFAAQGLAAAPAPGPMPEPGSVKAPAFVKLERAKLPNGLNVVVAERHDLPTIVFNMVFEAGDAADQPGKPGVADLAGDGLMDGTTKLDALALSDRIGELGITMGPHTSDDFSQVSMTTFTTRLDPALALYADVIMHPAYKAEDVSRQKSLVIAAIKRSKDSPSSMAYRILPTLIYGPDHVYGALTREADIAKLTPENLRAFHDTWYQPDGSTLIVVGDTTLKDILPKIQAHFGAWAPVKTPARAITPVPAATKSVIYLINKPGTAQSVVIAAKTAPPRDTPDYLAIGAMNIPLGGTFTSRINMNLREGKHWAYGAGSSVSWHRGPGLFLSNASVQADKTAESLVEIRKELNDVVAGRPITATELTHAQEEVARSLPARWETTVGIASSVAEIAVYGLPDDYYNTYTSRVRALTTEDIRRAAETVLKPGAITWVIAGDRAKIEPGLKALGMEIRPIDADGNPVTP